MKRKTVVLPVLDGVDEKSIHLNRGEQRVVDYMLANGSITSMEAFQHLGETRLSARIFDLRTRYKIKSIRMEKINPEGEYNSYYAKYVFDFPAPVKKGKAKKALQGDISEGNVGKEKKTTKKASVKDTKATKTKPVTKTDKKATTKAVKPVVKTDKKSDTKKVEKPIKKANTKPTKASVKTTVAKKPVVKKTKKK